MWRVQFWLVTTGFVSKQILLRNENRESQSASKGRQGRSQCPSVELSTSSSLCVELPASPSWYIVRVLVCPCDRTISNKLSVHLLR